MSVLTLDLATTTGWAVESEGVVTSGTISFKSSRYEGGGMRYLRFRTWLRDMFETVKPEVVYFEEVRRHLSTDAAHVHGGLLAVLTAECEAKECPYQGIPVGTIKKAATGSGSAKKAAMIEAAARLYPDQEIVDDNQADALCILHTTKSFTA